MSRPLRFCMISIFYPPYSFGGDSIYLYRLCTELVKAGHEVDVIHCADSYHVFLPTVDVNAFPASDGITVHKLESGYGTLAPLLSHQLGRPALRGGKVARILASKEFDVIHFHNISLFGPAILKTPTPYPAVRLYTAHEHWLVCPVNVLWKNNSHACDKPTCLSCSLLSKRPPQLWRYTTLLEQCLKGVDQFLTPSQFCRDMHHSRGFQREMQVLPYFVPRVEEESDGRGDSPHSRPYFLFVGRLEKIKGVQEILHHFQGPGDYDLVVVGGGLYQRQLHEQAAGMSRVRFVGWMNPSHLGRYYRHAVAVVVPSVTYETFGIIVIEAFSFGTPAIVHNLGALLELVDRSGGGFTYRSQAELRQQMDRLAADQQLRQELGERGYRAYVEKWTPEPHLRLYQQYIEDVRSVKLASWEELRSSGVQRTS